MSASCSLVGGGQVAAAKANYSSTDTSERKSKVKDPTDYMEYMVSFGECMEAMEAHFFKQELSSTHRI